MAEGCRSSLLPRLLRPAQQDQPDPPAVKFGRTNATMNGCVMPQVRDRHQQDLSLNC